MALDGLVISNIVYELSETLTGGRINKIYQPEPDALILGIKNNRTNYKLLISASASLPLIYLTDDTPANPAVAPNFCMLLRKHLTGGRLTGLHMEPGDRIVFFDFLCTNEMGDLVTNTLAAELMGRYSNLVLIQSGKIIDALKRVDFEDSEIRQLLPGLPYTLPPKPNKPDFLATSAAALVPAKKTCRWLLLWAKRLAVSAPLLRGRLCGVPLAAKRPCWPVTWTKRRSRPCAPQSKT